MKQTETVELLKGMGWSDELISSYQRVSLEIDQTVASLPVMPQGFAFDFSQSSQNEMDLSKSPPNGSNNLSMAQLLSKENMEISASGIDATESVRSRILQKLEAAEILEIDLGTTRSLSPSFAYNVFGKLYDKLGDTLLSRLDFVNDSRNLKSRIIEAVERRRKINSIS